MHFRLHSTMGSDILKAFLGGIVVTNKKNIATLGPVGKTCGLGPERHYFRQDPPSQPASHPATHPVTYLLSGPKFLPQPNFNLTPNQPQPTTTQPQPKPTPTQPQPIVELECGSANPA